MAWRDIRLGSGVHRKFGAGECIPRRAGWIAVILIVEILSPSTRRRDQVKKRSLYLNAGVVEHWMVDPELRAITAVRAGFEDVRVFG